MGASGSTGTVAGANELAIGENGGATGLSVEMFGQNMGINLLDGKAESELVSQEAIIAFLDSLIQDKDEEILDDMTAPLPLSSDGKLKDDLRAQYMEVETMNVTVSKSTVGLDPNKHSVVLFCPIQMAFDSDGNSAGLGVSMGKGMANLGKKGLGGSLKIARTAKILNKPNQLKENKFKAGHNTLVPLRE